MTTSAPLVGAFLRLLCPPVERGSVDTELLGHLGDIVGAVGHEGRGHGQLFALELAWPSTALASRPCRFQPCHGSFTNEVTLELGQRCKQVKHQLARGGVGMGGPQGTEIIAP